ncbi:tetratricopeptide repeat protein [Nodosilinea sp. LEGE 07088]|uniref:tetratricopeptide repeat protein n=1 Tax=Nodosilinea sp. LEGE 07088 TaxID=2777968 RepID=UPI00187DEF97|nr:tetratricopeptide repeat protein [Nodosilinea sp. LEGE 07088]MBE9138534.1 tetratricopeptide repeat protein [Nodosilinea sp. LEGE 07088]
MKQYMIPTPILQKRSWQQHSQPNPWGGRAKGQAGPWAVLSLCTIAMVCGLEMTIAPVALAQRSPQVSQGYALLERGWVNDAIAAFQSALTRQPNSVEARLGLATAYQRAGRDGDAWQAYQAVIQVDPDNPAALSALGTLGGYRPEWQIGGIEALTRLLGQNPNNTAVLGQRALLYGYQGRFTQSLADYDRLLAQNPSPPTLLGAAQIYAFSGDYEGALALFNRYRQTGPLPTEVLTAYALALQETGDPAAAIALLEPELREASRTDDLSLTLRTALANAYDTSGATARALALLAPLEGNEAARLSLARAYSAIGRRQNNPELFEQATVLYRQALNAAVAPSYGLRVEVADVLSEWPGTEALALEMFEQLAQENPGVASLAVQAHLLTYRLGLASAATVAEQLLPLVTPMPVSAPEQRAIATALVRLDHPDVALLPVYDAVAAAVDVPLLTYRLAQIYLDQGDLQAARDALAAYSAADQNDWGTALLIADLERQLGELDASARRYETILAAQPGAAVTADALRGVTFVRTLQGQPEAALPLYEAAIAADPDNTTYPLGYALLAYRTGQITAPAAAETLTDWLAFQDLDSPPPELFELVGALPADRDRADLYPVLLAQRPNDLWLRWRTIELMAQADPAQAQAELEALIAAQPDDVTVYFFQGELAQQQGNLPLAAAAYEQVLERDPGHLGALSALAGVRFQQGNWPAARALYGQVLEAEPDNWGARYGLAELNLADDQKLAGLEQLRQLAPGAEGLIDLEQRAQEVEFELLRRRGFQPGWERY